MKTRHGCLALLLIWGLLGVFLQYKYDIGAGQGGAIFFFVGLMGLGIYVVICLIDLINGFNSQRRSKLRGFEVLPSRDAQKKE